MNEKKRKLLKSSVVVGFALFVLSMLAFFVVYCFFIDLDYWNISMKINSFVMPFLYAIVGFLSVYWLRGSMKITFYKAFIHAFITMLLGGFFSLLSIFIFLNYIDTNARDILTHQYVELELKNLDNKYYKIKGEIVELGDENKLEELDKNYLEAKQAREIAMKEKRNYFSFNFLSAIFGSFILFYILLSIVIASFLKNKKSYE